MRTITTNKTSASVPMDFTELLAKQIASSKKMLVQQLMDDTFGKSPDGVEKLGDVHRRVDRVITRRRTVSYSDGYWAKIEINETDHVSYKVFNSGWLAKTFNKIGFQKVIVNGWDSVKQRDTVEATLGATYMAIDEAIAEDLKSAKHSKFLKEMIKTDPENLKAIAQLDMLDKGDGPGTAVEPVLSASGVSSAKTYSQNIAISGSGTYSKLDSSKPAALSVGPLSVGGGMTSLSFGNDEEAMKVDPDGSISFGNKVAEAIKHVVQETETKKGEVDE